MDRGISLVTNLTPTIDIIFVVTRHHKIHELAACLNNKPFEHYKDDIKIIKIPRPVY